MKYAEFAAQLELYSDLELVFEFDDTRIRRDYHLTEVLRLTVDAIDCGGAVDHWTETVLQLVEPGHADGERFMSAGKARDILHRSQFHVPLPADSELLLEFRAAGASTAQRFHVTRVQPGEAGELRVQSEGARTQCKAAMRSRSARGAKAATGSCCAADTGSDSSAATSACCSPGAVAKQSGDIKRCCA